MTQHFTQSHLRALGFVGFRPLSIARSTDHIPRTPGIYVVLLEPASATFLDTSVGGHFKRKDPTVPVRALTAKWVPDTPVMYIGRASDLQRRLRLLDRYGHGEPVAHQGGRYLWQLADHERLHIAWRLEADPVGSEASLLEDFERVLGQLPYANLVRGTKAVALA